MITLADILKYNRTEIFKYSLSKAAGFIGITKGHLHDLESGRHKNPTLKVFNALCKTYKLDPKTVLRTVYYDEPMQSE